jgi:hypothetical protein
VKFATYSKTYINLNVRYNNKKQVNYDQLTYKLINWKTLMELIIQKLSSEYPTMETARDMKMDTLKIIVLCLFSLYHVILRNCVGKFNRHRKGFNMQKKIIRIMAFIKKAVSY